MSLPGVHSDFPDDRGENAIARALFEASGGAWQLWFGLRRASNEIDALVLAPEVGAFAIEVKAWQLRSIKEYSDDDVVTGSGRHIHPLRQAKIALDGVRSHLDERGIPKALKPYMYATAALPRIHRTEMYELCGDEFSRHFEGMIFRDDLVDSATLIRRLNLIAEKPPISPPRRRHRPRPDQIAEVTRILNRRVHLQHRPVDDGVRKAFAKVHDASKREQQPMSRPAGNRPLKAEQRRTALQVPGTSLRDGVSRVVFHGKAGTGKTTELLKIALAHALAGRQALVCCYNLVLAADLRTRLMVLPEFQDAGNNLMIANIDQFGASAGENRVDFGGFQTICVDEAQDVEQERLDALSQLAVPEAEWFLSDAPEQALYARRSQFLDDAVKIARRNGTWESKRVNLRSGVAGRLVSEAALQVAPDTSRIPSWVEQYPLATTGTPTDQGVLELDVEPEERGHLPELTRLPDDTRWDVRVHAYEQIVREEIRRQGGDPRTLDLAIVSVRVDDMKDEFKKVKAALDRLALPYLDQLDKGNRRRSPVRGEVRLSTVHSMRGVDAERVLLLDVEGMEIIPQEDARPKLLNIALSRARAGTRVVLRPMPAQDGSYRQFVESLVHAYEATLG